MDDGNVAITIIPATSLQPAGYVRPVVKIELGARSDDWPHQEKAIQLPCRSFPTLGDGCETFPPAFSLRNARFGKSTPLARGNISSRDKPRKIRMARHYTMSGVITRGVAERAAQDRPLFDAWPHREIFPAGRGWTTPRSIRARSVRAARSPP